MRPIIVSAIKNIAALMLGLLMALPMGEVMVRIANIAPPVGRVERNWIKLSENPRLGYEPNRMPFTNSLGFRDYEHSMVKKAGAFRIIVLGDSLVDGYKILDSTKTFPFLTEQLLKPYYPGIEILNFGVSGYATSQEVEMLKSKGLAFQPDLVILTFCLNDFNPDDAHLISELLNTPQLTPAVQLPKPVISILMHSALFRFLLYYNWNQTRINHSTETAALLKESKIAEPFHELKQLSVKNRFNVLILISPLFPIPEDMSKYRHFKLHETVNKLSQINGFPFFDLLATYHACQTPDMYIDLYHTKPSGHACVAKALANYLQANMLPELLKNAQ